MTNNSLPAGTYPSTMELIRMLSIFCPLATPSKSGLYRLRHCLETPMIRQPLFLGDSAAVTPLRILSEIHRNIRKSTQEMRLIAAAVLKWRRRQEVGKVLESRRKMIPVDPFFFLRPHRKNNVLLQSSCR